MIPEAILRNLPRRIGQGLIRVYQLTLSGLAGSQCRHLPTCSHFTSEAIARHGLWVGGWIGLARIYRCRPGGTSGYDPAPLQLPEGVTWTRPWAYGRWRGPLPEASNPDYDEAARTTDREVNR